MMSRVLKFSLVVFAFFLFSFSPARKVTIWMIGDSTMALKKKERSPESGWGVEFKLFVNENAIVNNRAASGRSSKSFVAEKRWLVVLDSIQPGDYVIIQFGHNDEKEDSLLHTDAKTTYKQYLKKFIDETRSKGANPVICSSIVRRHFDGNGKLLDTHGDYISASREIANETNTPFIDMEAISRQLVSELGPERSKTLYTMRKGVLDSTHLNHDGARQIAELFVSSVKKYKLSLANFFR